LRHVRHLLFLAPDRRFSRALLLLRKRSGREGLRRAGFLIHYHWFKRRPLTESHHDGVRQHTILALIVETAAYGTPNTNTPGTNGAGLLVQSYVETSNVNVAEELVNMIQTQRAYEINSKAISASDQMLQKLTQL
jgi:hypothetical protein